MEAAWTPETGSSRKPPSNNVDVRNRLGETSNVSGKLAKYVVSELFLYCPRRSANIETETRRLELVQKKRERPTVSRTYL